MIKASGIKELYRSASIRSMAIYTFTNFFGKGASFLLLFIFTNPLYISPSENGLLSLFSNALLFLMPFLSMGIIHSTSADYFKLSRKEFRDFFSTGFVLPVIVMVLAMALLFLFRDTMQSLYGFPPMFALLIPLITFLTFCNEQFLSLARNNNEPSTYLKANLSKIILELGISFVLVVFFAWRWQGRVAGILIAYVIVAMYALYYFIKRGYLFGRIRKDYLRNELVYALPVITMQASIFCMSSSDRFFLSYFTTDHNETVGIYSIAATFASIITVLCTALLQYLFPRIYTQLSRPEVNYRDIRKAFLYYVAAMTGGLLLIMIFIPFAYHFFINERYHAALNYVFLLCMGCYFWTITYFFYSFLLYYKEKRKLMYLSVCCIITSLLMNWIMVRWMGAFGAAIANALTYFIVLLFTLYFTRQYWKKFLILKNVAN